MPDISKITLPSGTTYDIKDTVARNAIAGGVTFIIAWDGTSTPVVADIPYGVKVQYNSTTYTGTLSAETTGSGTHAQAGAFYLVKSQTQAGSTLDVYDEYVPVGTDGSKTWEKLGDTQVDLSDVVTDVSLSKITDTVIGSDATLTFTPTTTYIKATASGANTAWNSKDSVTALINAKPKENSSTSGLTDYVQYVKSQGTATTTKLSASASGGAVSASGDSVTALTGLGTPSTQTAVKSVSPTTAKLATSTVTGVQSSTTTASKATAATSQTTATGAFTIVDPSSPEDTTDANSNNIYDANECLLAGVSVANETLTIRSAVLTTQTTTQQTFSDVTVPIKANSSTTVATGSTTSSGSGADVVTGVSVGDTFSAVTGYESPTTDTVLGTASTFSVTDPSITIASGSSGDVTVATGINNATTRYLTIDKTTDTVIGSDSTFTITQPTVALSTDSSSGTGKVQVETNGSVSWDAKDTVTVLTSATDVSVTKGNQ